MSAMFSKDDLDHGAKGECAAAMLEVILAFARLDTALSAWLIHAYGMPLSRGALLVENMDMGNKINRLKKLYSHDAMNEPVRALSTFKKEFEDHKNIRNTIAHASFVGTRKDDPKTAVFSPVKTGAGPGLLQVVFIQAEGMHNAAAWAHRSADAIIQIYQKFGGETE